MGEVSIEISEEKETEMPRLEIVSKDLSFSYGAETRDPVKVLTNINLEIVGPQLISILGPNGVGKSTLIHCMNKILSPTDGLVYVNGRDLGKTGLKELAKTMGYVPYSGSSGFPLSVMDAILIGRHPHSKWGTKDDDLEIVHETMKMVGIEHLALRPINELSAGQHQKVMLARGFAQEPKILLLDEPTANLDIKHQLEVTRLLKNMSREKKVMVIMISHDLNIAARYSDNVILMKDGEIHAVGTPEYVITEENILTVYGVKSNVINHDGRPHVILYDDELKDSPAEGYVLTTPNCKHQKTLD